MSDSFDYKILFNQALKRIKILRDPRATKPDAHDLGWDIVKKQAMFDFGGKEFSNYINVVDSARNISISCLGAIISYLCKQNNLKLEPVEIHLKCEGDSKILFCFRDHNDNSLLLFKEIEECSLWKRNDIEPADIQKILNENGASSCKYIYLVFDYAYLQIVGHNDDETDPGRGYNVYSIKWFFENYFGENEYGLFLSSVQEYCIEVNNYLGYIFIKSLTPNALISFRRVVENEIIKFDYRQLLKKVIQKRKAYILPEADFNMIESQYLKDKVCRIALGDHDFAESLITAEWLINSMEKAKAIDLTVIGMGYLKAVEQLLLPVLLRK